MREKHEVENLMRSTMENLRDMIDVNTVIGDTVQTGDGTCIIPISKVTFGFASGGSNFGEKSINTATGTDDYPFGGGSGAGVTVKPVAFLVVKDDLVRLLPVDYDNSVDKIIDSIPQVLDFFKSLTKNKGVHNKISDEN